MLIRYLLYILICLPAASYACSMGGSVFFHSFHLNQDNIGLSGQAFFNKQFGENIWEWADENWRVKTPKLVENSAVIPVSFGQDSKELAGKYASVSLYAQYDFSYLKKQDLPEELIHEIEATQDSYRMADDKIYSWREALDWAESQVFHRIATFNLSQKMIPWIGLRLQARQFDGLKVFAVFIPKDEAAKALIVTHGNKLPIYDCNRHVFMMP